MASEESMSVEERVRNAQVEARARNISHNVRCLECGHQSIEESAADIAVRLRKVEYYYSCLVLKFAPRSFSRSNFTHCNAQVIRDDIRAGRTDKEIYERLTTEYGETILYSPTFDAQTAILWLGPVSPRPPVRCISELLLSILDVDNGNGQVAVIGAIAGATFYRGRARQRDVGRMADALLEGIPLSPSEHRMLKSLVLPPSQRRAWTWPRLWSL